jgi:hypothetical protein
MSAAQSTKSAGMKFGAEPKKIAILGVLLAAALGVYFFGGDSGTTGNNGGSAAVTTPSAITPVAPPSSAGNSSRRRRTGNERNSERNTLKMQEVTLEAQQGNIDPTLRLDLLKRLQTVKFEGAGRNLFEVGPATPEGPAKSARIMPGPLPPQPAPPPDPAAAQAQAQAQIPQIPLRFYGFTAPTGAANTRRGFFLDGDNIIVASEGDAVVNGRYRIMRLSPQSALVMDTQNNNQQELRITPEGQDNAGGM